MALSNNTMQEVKRIFILLISFLISKLAFIIFQLENNVIYVVFTSAICFILLNNILKKKDFLKNITVTVTSAIFSFCISTSIIIGSKINFDGAVNSSYLINNISSFCKTDFLKIVMITIIVFIIVINLIIFLKDKNIIKTHTNEMTRKTKIIYWLIMSLSVILCWLPYLMSNLPGSVLADSLSSIYQSQGMESLSNHHPVAYTFCIKIFLKIGSIFGSYNAGVFIYTVTQYIIMAGVIGYSLLWLKLKRVKTVYIFLTWVYFIGNFLFAAYAITMWKDPLFSSFLFLMVLLLFDIIKSNGYLLEKKGCLLYFTVLSLLICFFRNNGFMIVVSISLILCLMYKFKYKKYNIAVAIMIIFVLCIQGPVYKMIGIKSEFVESLGIPLQQMASVVANDGKMTIEQEKFLYELLPRDEYKKTYAPCLVDTIKWNPSFNDEYLEANKKEFFNVWAKMMLPNLGEYVKAYIMETFGFWNIGSKNSYGFVDTYISTNTLNIHTIDLNQKLFGITVKNKPPKIDFISCGTLAWIILLVLIILIVNKQKKYIIPLLPCLLSWLSILVATPVAFSLRYVFMIVLSLPFLVMIPFLSKNSEVNSNEGE